MKKQDLKDGMIVENKHGERMIVKGKLLVDIYGKIKSDLIVYDEDLCYNGEPRINKVFDGGLNEIWRRELEEYMSLYDFVTSFVCKNTLIRLWKPVKGGHEMLVSKDNSVCMEWQLVKNEVWQSKYNDCMVIGVKDIVVDDSYKEAVNIVIDAK